MKETHRILSVQIDKLAIDRLRDICKAEKRSQAKTIELMIESYNYAQVERPVIVEPSSPVLKSAVKPKAKAMQVVTVEKKVAPRAGEPTLADLWKQQLKGQ
jgi:regulator of extracellular matrix RemA (YlzA/DUF370 family)